MKNRLIIIICSFLFLSSKYSKAINNDSDDDWITFEYGITTIVTIEDNKFLRKRFHFDFEPYEELRDTIVFETSSELRKHINVTYDKLIYNGISESRAEIREYSVEYKRLEKYSQAKFKNKLSKLLLESNYLVEEFLSKAENEKVELDFLDCGIFLTKELKHKYSINQFWEIDTYKDELFLVFDSGLVFQIESITDNEINAILYRENNERLRLKQAEYSTKFDLNLLEGTWKEVKIIDKKAPKAPPVPENFRKEELLIIEPKYITRKYENKVLKLQWLSNKSLDRIIFLEKWDIISERQWKIKKLTEDELILLRINELENRLIEIKFIKI